MARCERAAQQAANGDGDGGSGGDGYWPTEEEWLGRFEQWGREGLFDREADFPLALATYRLAVERARARPDPPFDPPPEFMPNLADLPRLRLSNWRTESRFPAVRRTLTWLSAMLARVREGKPPVTMREFEELAAWYRDKGDAWVRAQDRDGLADLGGGRRESATNLGFFLGLGPFDSWATKVVEDLRRLRALVEASGPGGAGSGATARG
jgi:hypothetical protein